MDSISLQVKFLKTKISVLIILLIASIFLSNNIYTQKSQINNLISPTPIEYLESYFKNRNEYDETFAKYENVTKINALAVITSHHFLAKDLIAQTFSGINPSSIQNVIIISPDHYNQINEPGIFIKTIDSRWHTPFGNMEANENLIKILLKEKGINSGINLFRQEHGIYTLVPFAKKALPNVKIIPLVLKQSSNYQYFYDFGNKLTKISNPRDTILVVSSDFTHDSSTQIAKLNDQKSINLLPNKKLENINSITNDCKQCTAFLFGYLQNIDTDFKLIFNKNSFDLSEKNPNSATSYVGAYFVAK
jgi:AmmeMemoRadiSam system protein B